MQILCNFNQDVETVSHADLKGALHSVAERAGEVLAGSATAVAEDCALFEGPYINDVS